MLSAAGGQHLLCSNQTIVVNYIYYYVNKEIRRRGAMCCPALPAGPVTHRCCSFEPSFLWARVALCNFNSRIWTRGTLQLALQRRERAVGR